MIVVDVNLLIYAVDQGSPRHEGANRWWLAALAGRETIGLPWSTVLAFARLTTNPRIFTHPLSTDHAFDLLDTWTAHSHVIPVEPTSRHLALVRGFSTPQAPLGTSSPTPIWLPSPSNTAPRCTPPTPTSPGSPACDGPTPWPEHRT